MGEWRTEPIGYLKPYDVVCDLCGQLVPGRHWTEEVDGEPKRFCDERHAGLYRTYWLPRHGREAVGA